MKTPSILFNPTPCWDRFDTTKGEELSLKQMCEQAGWRYNLTGSFEPRIFVGSTGFGHKQFSIHGQKYFFIDKQMIAKGQENDPRRWLEVLAYSFFDYRAREVCRGKFGPPEPNIENNQCTITSNNTVNETYATLHM